MTQIEIIQTVLFDYLMAMSVNGKIEPRENAETLTREKMLANIEKDFKEIESLGIHLLFEYATTIEHLKSISDNDFKTIKDTIITVYLVKKKKKGGLGNTPKIYKKGR